MIRRWRETFSLPGTNTRKKGLGDTLSRVSMLPPRSSGGGTRGNKRACSTVAHLRAPLSQQKGRVPETVPAIPLATLSACDSTVKTRWADQFRAGEGGWREGSGGGLGMRDAQSGWDRDKGGERGFKAFSTGGDKFISPEEKWKWHNMVNLSFIRLSLSSCFSR